METNINTEELIRLKGYFQQKYGFEVDDFTVSFLNEINEGFDKLKEKTEESLAEIKDASSKIKASKRQILFQTKEVAFWYAMGFFIPFALTFIVAFFLFYSAFIYQKRHDQVKTKQVSKTEKKLKKSSKIRSKDAKLGHFRSN